MSQTPDPSRRQLLAVAGAAALTPSALAQTQPAAPATQSTTGPSLPFEEVDIDAAGRLLGRTYADTERQLMRGGLAQTRQFIGRLRQREIPADVEAAVTFDPVFNGVKLPHAPVRLQVTNGEWTYNGDIESLAFATIAELQYLLEHQKITSVQLARLCLGRLRKHGETLHCVVNLTEELAMRQARRADEERQAGRVRGPLHGIPWGAKDLLATKGYATTYGVAPYRDRVIDVDATVVQRLEEAGAVLVAKLSLGELAMGDVWYGGLTRNPWDPEKGSSGSSAGPCAAVAAGLVPFAIGSETLGSIISPCVVCGTTGLRPTYGRVPRTGALPLTRTMDKLGPITRSVHDLAYVLHAIAGPDGQDPTCHDVPLQITSADRGGPDTTGIRVGFDKHAFDALQQVREESTRQLYSQALQTCRKLFGELVPVELPRDRMSQSVAMATIEVEGAESFSELIDADGLQQLVQQEGWNWPNTFRRAGLFPAVDYLRAQRVRRQLMAHMNQALGDVDVFVTIPRVGPNLVLTNLTGHPACILRAGVLEGKPHQIEFVGRLYGEAALLATASRFEQTVEARDEWPRQRWS